MRMAEGNGRWLLVTFDLPTRSEMQRREADRFVNWLTRAGYVRIHGHAHSRYLPPKARAATELNRMRKEVPAKGTVYALEVSDAGRRRGLLISNSELVPSEELPELLTIY